MSEATFDAYDTGYREGVQAGIEMERERTQQVLKAEASRLSDESEKHALTSRGAKLCDRGCERQRDGNALGKTQHESG